MVSKNKTGILTSIVIIAILIFSVLLLPIGVYAKDFDISVVNSTEASGFAAKKQTHLTTYNGVDYSAVYDYDYYYDTYLDVQTTIGTDEAKVLEHFINIGMGEGRQACLSFDVQSYYNGNQDLRIQFGYNLRQYYLYYMENYKIEKRPCIYVSKLLDPITKYCGIELNEIYNGEYYMVTNWDVYTYYTMRTKYVTLVDDYSILYHFVNNGIRENRKGNTSDYWKNRKTANWTSVVNIIQYPELPSGCESVSLTIALNHYGFNLDKTTIADYYMPAGESIIDSFPGDQYMEESSGCMPPAVTIAANNFLATQNTDLKAYNISGSDINFLYALIDMDCPVVVWSTLYMEEPKFEDEPQTLDGVSYYQWYWPEHCIVLYGYDKANDLVYISDPNEGDIEASATYFEGIYDSIGRYAVVIK